MADETTRLDLSDIELMNNYDTLNKRLALLERQNKAGDPNFDRQTKIGAIKSTIAKIEEAAPERMRPFIAHPSPPVPGTNDAESGD